jgi:hypothetical protein
VWLLLILSRLGLLPNLVARGVIIQQCIPFATPARIAPEGREGRFPVDLFFYYLGLIIHLLRGM